VIQHLEAVHGPVVFFQSAGCCEGSAPICLRQGELPPGPGDLRLGELSDAPYYIDSEQYRRWNRPQFVLDVSPGPADGFSLEGSQGLHFVTRAE
jgi:uncharacterized protein (DUF779 family)